MMKTLKPVKSPHLLVRPIEKGYYYAVNCCYPNSFRILNKPQYEILNEVDGQRDLSAIGGRLSIQPDKLVDFFTMLSKTEIIRFDNEFSEPQKPANPKSLNFWIHTTNRCNLTCSYCYISTLNTTSGMMDDTKRQLLRKLIETAQKRKIKHITLRLAGGEPLSQFRSWKSFIIEGKAALKDVGCHLAVSFITNLTILTEEILAFSQEQKISFGVSIDGLETFHDKSRKFSSGKGSFALVDTNIRQLLSNKIPFSTNTVINNGNLENLPQLTRYLIGLDIPFRYSIVKGEAIDSELLEKNLSESYAIMREAIEEGWKFSSRYKFCDLKPNEPGFQTCASGFSGGAIYVDGTLNYCHVNFGDPTQPSNTIFNEEMDLVEMIAQGSHPEETRSKDCTLCKYKAVCTSGCPIYRVGDKDPHCSIYHKFIPLYYELQARERLKLLREHQKI